MRRLGEFWRGRIETGLDERGIAYDLREATLEARPIAADGRSRPGWIDPCEALDRARVLAAFRSDARFEPLAILFKRVSNILKAATEPLPGAFDRAAMREPAEHELVTALERARAKTDPLWERRSYAEILPVLLEMEQAIHTFFDRVLVNAEDTATRLNRLQLLSEVRALFLRGWDVSKVVGSLQILATNVNLGESVSPDMPLSKLLGMVLGFPVRNQVFALTPAKLAAMTARASTLTTSA